MTERKSFFRERITKEIREMDLTRVTRANGLVKRILNLNPSEEALEIRMRIIPGEFFQKGKSGAEASRKCYKHGKLIRSSQPTTQTEAYDSEEIPLNVRQRDFGELRDMRENEINFMGYSFRPVQGNDRRARVVPFVWLAEGARLFAYAENQAGKLEVKPYDDAERVAKEGAEVVCNVPSRTKKKGRYTLRLRHVPVIPSYERGAVTWSLSSNFEEGNEPEHQVYNIKYNFREDRAGSDVFTFYPQEIAAYMATAKHYLKEKRNWRGELARNMTPLEMTPLAWISKLSGDFYKRLNNNLLIYDPTLSGKDKLRKLHVAEKSVLIGRSIGVLGHDATMYWDPQRDGAIKDYDWSIPK